MTESSSSSAERYYELIDKKAAGHTLTPQEELFLEDMQVQDEDEAKALIQYIRERKRAIPFRTLTKQVKDKGADSVHPLDLFRTVVEHVADNEDLPGKERLKLLRNEKRFVERREEKGAPQTDAEYLREVRLIFSHIQKIYERVDQSQEVLDTIELVRKAWIPCEEQDDVAKLVEGIRERKRKGLPHQHEIDEVLRVIRERRADGQYRAKLREIHKKLPAARDMTVAQRKLIVSESNKISHRLICETYNISRRTLQRWRAKYK
jgi:hypothetical protein